MIGFEFGNASALSVHVVVGGTVDDRVRVLTRDERPDGGGIADVEELAGNRQDTGASTEVAHDGRAELTRRSGDEDSHQPLSLSVNLRTSEPQTCLHRL